MKTLVVGDHFVPTSYFVDALKSVWAEEIGPVATMSLSGSKKAQHETQQVMEVHGTDSISPDPALVEAMRDADIVLVHFAPVPAAAFEGDSSLRAVVAARAGVENIDVEAATKAGAAVFNVLGRNASAVAELAIGLMLAEARNIARADRSVKDGGWVKDFGGTPIELGGRCVGLVGFGHVGRLIARRLEGFDCRILVADPYCDPEEVENLGVELVALETLFAQSDYISLQARVTPETREMVDSRLIGLMQPDSYLINVGRSRLVKTADLLDALRDQRIRGAGLDVFDEEPLPSDSEWRNLDNVTLTTHFAGDSVETNVRSARLVAETAYAFARGENLEQAVNYHALTK